MHQIRFRLGFCPKPRSGSLRHSPDPIARFQGSTSKEGKGKGRGRGEFVTVCPPTVERNRRLYLLSNNPTANRSSAALALAQSRQTAHKRQPAELSILFRYVMHSKTVQSSRARHSFAFVTVTRQLALTAAKY